MKLLSIEHIPGVEFEALGLVKGTAVSYTHLTLPTT